MHIHSKGEIFFHPLNIVDSKPSIQSIISILSTQVSLRLHRMIAPWADWMAASLPTEDHSGRSLSRATRGNHDRDKPVSVSRSRAERAPRLFISIGREATIPSTRLAAWISTHFLSFFEIHNGKASQGDATFSWSCT